MAIIYAKADGEIVGVRKDSQEAIALLVAPYVSSLEFDEVSNPGILPRYSSDHNNHKLLAGILSYKGQGITINPESEVTAERKAVLTLFQELKAYNALASPTNAQSVAAIKANNRLTLILGRLLLAEMQD